MNVAVYKLMKECAALSLVIGACPTNTLLSRLKFPSTNVITPLFNAHRYQIAPNSLQRCGNVVKVKLPKNNTAPCFVAKFKAKLLAVKQSKTPQNVVGWLLRTRVHILPVIMSRIHVKIARNVYI